MYVSCFFIHPVIIPRYKKKYLIHFEEWNRSKVFVSTVMHVSVVYNKHPTKRTKPNTSHIYIEPDPKPPTPPSKRKGCYLLLPPLNFNPPSLLLTMVENLHSWMITNRMCRHDAYHLQYHHHRISTLTLSKQESRQLLDHLRHNLLSYRW